MAAAILYISKPLCLLDAFLAPSPACMQHHLHGVLVQCCSLNLAALLHA